MSLALFRHFGSWVLVFGFPMTLGSDICGQPWPHPHFCWWYPKLYHVFSLGVDSFCIHGNLRMVKSRGSQRFPPTFCSHPPELKGLLWKNTIYDETSNFELTGPFSISMWVSLGPGFPREFVLAREFNPRTVRSPGPFAELFGWWENSQDAARLLVGSLKFMCWLVDEHGVYPKWKGNLKRNQELFKPWNLSVPLYPMKLWKQPHRQVDE